MGALIVHDDVLEKVSKRLDQAEQLVWFARKHPAGHPAWDKVPAEIKEGALNSAAKVQEMFPDEVDELRGDNGDWHHGFNSGVLAALRWVLHAAADPESADECWPELDT